MPTSDDFPGRPFGANAGRSDGADPAIFGRSRTQLLPILLGAFLVTLTASQALAQASFIRGDINQDDSANLADVVTGLEYLVGAISAPPCLDAADFNDDELLDISDPIALLSSLFAGSGPLPPPLACGTDPTGPDLLGCASYALCPSGSFPAEWIHGSPSCGSDTNPPIQVHAYNSSVYILRQNMCIDFEAPFMFLFLGQDRALLLDSGATSSASQFPIAATVTQLVEEWRVAQGLPSIELVVAHTHGHGDHTAGDGQFLGLPNTTVVSASLSSVTSYFGFTSWPNEIVEFDLGDRTLDLIPVPGHSSADVAYYDRQSELLVTGDSFYPGFVFVNDSNWTAFSSSIERLYDFASTRPIAAVLGTHIEMTANPGVAYPYGSTYQPNEHDLQLTFENLEEFYLGVQALGSNPMTTIFDDFILQIY